ncbi:2-dehydro-3-deoxy-6-phosphogalactonate aldolase [Aliivibrio fischeri]|uniref:2-dehydro-3-deoxy-6-phosphogalactonate aldolase n=1 Tax=Aliivibrio fischeri TaxID=668 RepID=UPI0012D96C6C|nr:2-dehydro-3-deoxy-6-phosphogalactonate aldolase [Aliivibrio fischeri]MUK36522.1 2-dehydro-3-deoxy-6-phosphogalactonate aldolase [Aliivibrio fischeri]MUL05815.1 2-dehydro-3-deoxy-6-phosphogalactonate aldolase [Aliivibrio fischeri]
MANLKANPFFQSLPLVAILRGILPSEILPAAKILIEEGDRFIEVPLNSPDALMSIKLLVDEYGDEAIVGAGTVTDQQKLIDVLETGAKLIVTPNMNPDVISIASKRGCIVMPGVQTTTEAFTALSCGASALKFFPAEVIGAKGIKAMKSVLPEGTVCLPVGGVAANKESMQEYLDVGADGFGLGSGLYQKGMPLEELKSRSHAYKKAWLGTQK